MTRRGYDLSSFFAQRFTARQRQGNTGRAERSYARHMNDQLKGSGCLSPLFVEEERPLPLTLPELRAASRAMAFAYDTDTMPVVEANALISAHFKVKEALADGRG